MTHPMLRVFSDTDFVTTRAILDGAGGQRTFAIHRGETVTIRNFGGVGRGTFPTAAILSEVDTLQFQGTGLTTARMLLQQVGADLQITFDGVPNTQVTLQNFALENLDNLLRSTRASVDAGNILFNGQSQIQDSFDVIDANAWWQWQVFNRDTTTFLNDRNNFVWGFEFSRDIIHGLGGDDFLYGLSGADVLRGGTGKDALFGGRGRDTLYGGAGDDTLRGGWGRDRFSIAQNQGTDQILDFEDGRDALLLERGLTFRQLQVTQVGNDTAIQLKSTGATLATLLNTQSSTIGREDFILETSFNQLVVFGDSLSDTGNIFNLLFRLFPPSPPYFNGRFSNGPIWVDQIAPRLGFDPTAVQNFAFGGAKTGRENTGDSTIPNLPGLLDTIDTFTTRVGGTGADPESLYVVWAGANDLRGVSDPQIAATIIRDAVNNLETALTRLVNLGAETILVPNTLDLGLLPENLRAGISAQARDFSLAFNAALAHRLESLETTLDADLIGVDVFALSEQIAANPGGFGFTNLTDPLINQSNPTNPAGFLFWDDVHPTTQAHTQVTEIFETVISHLGISTPEVQTLAADPLRSLSTLVPTNPLIPAIA